MWDGHRMVRCGIAFALIMGAMAFGEDGYEVLLPFESIRACSSPCCQYDLLGAHCFEGTTAYAIVRGIESVCTPEWESQLTRIDDITGTPVVTELMSYAAWKSHTGADAADNILPGNRMAVVGDHVQFLDVGMDHILRVHKVSGQITTFVSNQEIAAHLEMSDPTLIDAVAVSADKRMAFYEQTSDSIIEVDAHGGLTTLVIKEDFLTLYELPSVGTTWNAVSGGMSYDALGRLYWTLSSNSFSDPPANGSIFMRDCDGTLSKVIDELDIITAAGTFDPVKFFDLYVAPDGLVYFYHGGQTTDSIMYFDPDPVPPATVADTLGVMLTGAELRAGPATVDNLGSFSSFEGRLTWSMIMREAPDIYAKDLVGPEIRPADFDRDGDVDIDDYDLFVGCATGPEVLYTTLSPTCTLAPLCDATLPADFDKDFDIDQKDFGHFQLQYTDIVPPGP